MSEQRTIIKGLGFCGNEPLAGSNAAAVDVEDGKIVPIEIEIWPTSILLERGEKLRIVVQGSDIYNYPEEIHSNGHTETVNKGEHVIYTGGKYNSHLLVPVIPAD